MPGKPQDDFIIASQAVQMISQSGTLTIIPVGEVQQTIRLCLFRLIKALCRGIYSELTRAPAPIRKGLQALDKIIVQQLGCDSNVRIGSPRWMSS
ncbi:MAG: hypothetical protein GPOALKHO_001861 [Sodalis sp.]|uniref:hypothetical protein n=1 Tax=Sodalis sp. (in: enterobacteria) TaxID=1898979 RepID=UPI0038739093|nr:MAG: hypothetical protein GPOALKHO_001861 [Sodalis sp.]